MIKVFQSDSGGEFTSNMMKNHLQQCGIRHQISCPYTPQQNGTAERKHKHIIELGLSMMFHSHLPLHHWIEAFYTSTFLCNVLPSSVLDNKSPTEILFGKKPDLSSLRVLANPSMNSEANLSCVVNPPKV